MKKSFDVIILGAGAAGLMTAIQAGRNGLTCLVIDHANKPGKKILMSGGGRCNFTNLYVEPSNYLSENPHFCKSALSKYTQWDFIGMVLEHAVPYHEKEQGQLFCDNKAKDILNMLLDEIDASNATLQLNTKVEQVLKTEVGFKLQTTVGLLSARQLVVATGGLSIPTMGATGFGYELAEQFGHKLKPRRAGLVPFTFSDEHKLLFSSLSGTSLQVTASVGDAAFNGSMLFTHRGLSGPSILQVSSFWREGDILSLDLLPGVDCVEVLISAKQSHPKKRVKHIVSEFWPKSVVDALSMKFELDKVLADTTDIKLRDIGLRLNNWELRPSGTEGYRTAEVTLGGVDVDELSSKTMESKLQSGLYFVGEVVDVTGHLGGFNFQWAWSSAFACAQALKNS